MCANSHSLHQCCIGGAPARLAVLAATRSVWCAPRNRLSSTGVGVVKVSSIPFFISILYIEDKQSKQSRGALSVTDKLAVILGELAELERKIRELRGARASLTHDLEWALKEQDRLRRHLTPNPDEKGDRSA